MVEHPIKIAPSISSADQSHLTHIIELAESGGADLLHFDIEDGVFIPNLTFGPKTIKNLRSKSTLPFDVHLQVHRPEDYLEDVVSAGANVVTVQVESTRFPHQMLQSLRKLGVKVGLAFNAATPLAPAQMLLDHLQVIHLMTADPDGIYLPAVVGKVQHARTMIQDRPIALEVDGGVSFENVASLVEAGANILVAGRAIWNTKDPLAAIQRLRELATRARQA